MIMGAWGLGKKKGWTNPYVTDGLIAMWDGEWNAGGGVHDAAATTWVDLVGGVELSAKGNPEIRSDSVHFNGTSCFGKEFSVGTIGTFEIVCESVAQSGIDPEILRLDNSPVYKIYVNSNEISCGIATVGQFSSRLGLSKALGSWLVSASPQKLFKNGQHISDWNVSRALNCSGVVIGAGSTGLYRPSVCTVYCVRIYSRVLTAAEVAANYAIDKKRFNLP